MKANSKPSKSGKKRKQVPIMGTYEQYSESKKKGDSSGKMAQAPAIPNQNQGEILFLQKGPNG